MIRKLAGGLFVLLLTAIATPAAASDLTGSGGVGVRGGTLFFTQDKTISANSQPRISGDLVLSYAWTDHMTADITVGYGWNRLDTGDPRYYVATVVPLFPIGLRYKLWDGKTLRPYLGAGGGLYNWSILTHDLGAAKDPVTFERLRRVDAGAYGIVGVERQLSKHITATLDGNYTHIFADDKDRFPTGYSGAKSYFQFRLGVSFWFSLSERIDTGLPG
ncbi:MAG TPA: outer membrane beta-barrel protein [Candidatus Eisenbacteria bacterium]|nr:outer membrane beta-barrel protein [Candidatus Eisenbacteria bacterium]